MQTNIFSETRRNFKCIKRKAAKMSEDSAECPVTQLRFSCLSLSVQTMIFLKKLRLGAKEAETAKKESRSVDIKAAPCVPTCSPVRFEWLKLNRFFLKASVAGKIHRICVKRKTKITQRSKKQERIPHGLPVNLTRVPYCKLQNFKTARKCAILLRKTRTSPCACKQLFALISPSRREALCLNPSYPRFL